MVILSVYRVNCLVSRAGEDESTQRQGEIWPAKRQIILRKLREKSSTQRRKGAKTRPDPQSTSTQSRRGTRSNAKKPRKLSGLRVSAKRCVSALKSVFIQPGCRSLCRRLF